MVSCRSLLLKFDETVSLFEVMKLDEFERNEFYVIHRMGWKGQ